jgi:hypothetical protein
MIRLTLGAMALLAAPALANTPAAPQPAAPDGKVNAVNADTYAALKMIRKRNPGAFTEVDAKQLAAAIQTDGKVDAVETDLLKELTNSQFRSITITPANAPAGSTDKVTGYPVSGNAKNVLQLVLSPGLDLASEWAKPDHGWNAIVADYKAGGEREKRVLAFVTAEFRKKWDASTQSNGFKPLRDQLGKLYEQSIAKNADANSGRTLMYKAMETVDKDVQGKVPDFLYNWTRPGGYL